MIHYVVTRRHADTLATYLDTWGRRFHTTLRPLLYEALPFYRTLPSGTYIFTDLEELGPRWLELASAVGASLSTVGPACTLLNSPVAVLRRLELLQTLHQDGRNEFAVVRADQAGGSLRFPVFVRHLHEHTGSLTPLLTDRDALNRTLAELVGRGIDAAHLLVTEFCDTADENGLYRKFSAMRVGNRILPRHLLMSSKWVLKYADRVDAAAVEEEARYLADFPHEGEVAAIFHTANVDYGRIDYAIKNGRIQTWEINTNPTLVVAPDRMEPARLAGQAGFVKALAAAFDAIDPADSKPAMIDLAIPAALRTKLGATAGRRWRRKLSTAVGRLQHWLDRPPDIFAA